ncbi:MAG: hypothetical protein JSR17_10220 [Proteobacteria bacterium]|nr:hypothetical protein [Pseudomonadota bacterium]
MRNLSLNETLSITGAGYSEYIVTAAATVYTASSLFAIGEGFGKAAAVAFALNAPAAFVPLSTVLPLATAVALPACAFGYYFDSSFKQSVDSTVAAFIG